MKRIIRKVAVLGSGVMGSRIACHFAGTGVQVLLLDRVPTELTEAESAKNLSLDHPAVKNRIVNEALASAIKSNPLTGLHCRCGEAYPDGQFYGQYERYCRLRLDH